MSTWLITGASRGFGAEITRAALDAGHEVVATARDPKAVETLFPDASDTLLALPLDVTDQEQARAVVAMAAKRFGTDGGGIDVLVNNAGRGLLGAVEEIPDSAAKAVYETNVFGTLNVLRAVLPGMRRRRSGHIINISSVGGFTGAPGWGIYASTKFAVEGLSEALAGEVAPLGIKVTIVEPGYFRTDFLDASSLHTEGRRIDDYAATSGATRTASTDRNHTQPGDPAKAARVIVGLGGDEKAPLRLQLGADAVARVEDKLRFVQDELDMWREVATSTDHDDVAAR
ncbi:SDR family NAD(P)-dependent oxidoreductase [Streptomyces sp. GMY02]|uniref:oxidoreductase n=1 Tax=Streptomyces sp. GMY02 TaxID=1333528 RepID=UPI001C2CA607|nr:oxidoreductase [Streptomyces sp. GMY02]QXE33312.1 SDR family NAD(P)-dependent oxidoreductase [Streptomyces sp. GMY02]